MLVCLSWFCSYQLYIILLHKMLHNNLWYKCLMWARENNSLDYWVELIDKISYNSIHSQLLLEQSKMQEYQMKDVIVHCIFVVNWLKCNNTVAQHKQHIAFHTWWNTMAMAYYTHNMLHSNFNINCKLPLGLHYYVKTIYAAVYSVVWTLLPSCYTPCAKVFRKII